jgi:hypothetical protein
MTPPHVLDAMVRDRVGRGVPSEPTYADFFSA